MLFALPAFAAGEPPAVIGSIQKGLTGAGAASYGTANDIVPIISTLISASLGFLGVLLLVYLIVAGFLWMTAGGDEGKVKKARDMIKNAVIGIVIIASAFAIANSVLNALSGVTGGPAIQK